MAETRISIALRQKICKRQIKNSETFWSPRSRNDEEEAIKGISQEFFKTGERHQDKVSRNFSYFRQGKTNNNKK